MSFRIAICADVIFLIATLIGCGQSPLVNIEVDTSPASSSLTTLVTVSPTHAKRETNVVTTTFLDEFQLIKKTSDEQLKLIEEKIERQFLDSAMTPEEQNRLGNHFRTECEAVTAPLIPKVYELVKPHLTEILAIEPLIWLASHDDRSSTGHEAATLLFDVVKQHVNDPAVLEPLMWLATHKDKSSIGQDAVLLLSKHHLTSLKTIEMALRHHRSGMAWVETMLRAQLTSSELPEDQRPRLMFALAQHLKGLVQSRNGDSIRLDEAIHLYSEIQQKYFDIEHLSGLKFGELATQALFEITNLGVGRQAPDIHGEDLDGVAFNLSDYRGKVVMLSFWASWCGPCMAMIPHERELVKRFEGRPFVLIGVNGDMDKSAVLPIIERHRISWKSFWTGEKGPLGPIPLAWNVQSWPTFYLIDHTGVIKTKTLEDETIEKMVLEAEKAAND